MQKHTGKFGVVLIVAVVLAGMSVWGSSATADPKKVKPNAPVPQSGQTKCWDVLGNEIACAGTGQDGEIQAGVVLPSPRFTDNGDGTVTDNGTGLIWLRDGTCLGSQTWGTAFAVVSALADGNVACGLTDRSDAGDWRLPNVKEYVSLVDLGGVLTPGHPFINFTSSSYMTSTTLAAAPEKEWHISMADGQLFLAIKISGGGHITAVRGPK